MTTDNPSTDRETLTTREYGSDATLRARQQTHERYSVPKIDFFEWVLDRVEWRGDERVLDVGMGSGVYFNGVLARIPHGQYVACDLSMGMARKARQHPQAWNVDIFNGDAQALPFPDRAFDVVLANHMLYHVPNLDQALAEMHRILKPSGLLVTATNSRYNMPEFDQLMWRAYGLLGVSGQNVEPMKSASSGYQLEDAPGKLHRHFRAVVRYDLPGELIFPTAQPAVDYINSMRALRESQLPRRVSWEDFVGAIADQLQRRINHFGELKISKLSGVLVATDTGGFVSDYMARLGTAAAGDAPEDG